MRRPRVRRSSAATHKALPRWQLPLWILKPALKKSSFIALSSASYLSLQPWNAHSCSSLGHFSALWINPRIYALCATATLRAQRRLLAIHGGQHGK